MELIDQLLSRHHANLAWIDQEREQLEKMRTIIVSAISATEEVRIGGVDVGHQSDVACYEADGSTSRQQPVFINPPRQLENAASKGTRSAAAMQMNQVGSAAQVIVPATRTEARDAGAVLFALIETILRGAQIPLGSSEIGAELARRGHEVEQDRLYALLQKRVMSRKLRKSGAKFCLPNAA